MRDAFKDSYLRVTARNVDPPLTQEEMQAFGLVGPSYHISNIGSIAMYDFLMDFKERGWAAYNEFNQKHQNHPLGGFGVFDVAGFPKVVEWEKKYLPQETQDKYDQSLEIYDPRIGHQTRR